MTGASRCIGAAGAERLEQDIAVNYAGQGATGEELVRRIDAGGGRSPPVLADSSELPPCDAAEAALGGVGVLVNNAGVMILSSVADIEDATLDRQIAVNLKGPFNTLREAAARLRFGGGVN